LTKTNTKASKKEKEKKGKTRIEKTIVANLF
jgi:hypothetical protein